MNLPSIVRNGLAIVAVAATLVLMFAAGCSQSGPEEAKRERPPVVAKPVELPAEQPGRSPAGSVAGKTDKTVHVGYDPLRLAFRPKCTTSHKRPRTSHSAAAQSPR